MSTPIATGKGYTLSQVKRKKQMIRKLEMRLQKEANKAPKGALAAHTRACRMTHYESAIAQAKEDLRAMESNLTTRSSAKRERAKDKAKSQAIKLAQKYKKQKEEAAKEAAAAKREAAKAKREAAKAERETAKAEREAAKAEKAAAAATKKAGRIPKPKKGKSPKA